MVEKNFLKNVTVSNLLAVVKTYNIFNCITSQNGNGWKEFLRELDFEFKTYLLQNRMVTGTWVVLRSKTYEACPSDASFKDVKKRK